MSFGEQLRKRREALHISRNELADVLGVTRSAIGNYETGVSMPKEEVLLQIFDALQVEPNYLFSDSFCHTFSCTEEERGLVEKYRRLPLLARQALIPLLDAIETISKNGVN